MITRLLPDNVTVVNSMEDATREMQGFTASGGTTVPGCAFWQGRRLFFSSAIGFQKARQFLRPEAYDRKKLADKKVDPFEEVQEHFNRALDPSHFNAIGDYLRHNADVFVLPPLIVNARGDVRLLCVGDPRKAAMALSWLLYDDSFSPVITDGQHRQQGLSEALIRDHKNMVGNSIGLMVSFEQDVDQMHQDFADCAKTKPIASSLMQFYDRRAVSGRIVRELTERCPLFQNGKVDPQAKSITKGSIMLFLHSQVVSFIKASVAELEASTADFEDRLFKLNEDPEFIRWLVAYVNDVTDAIEPLRKAAALTLTERDKIPALRESAGLNAVWIPFTAPGLRMLGSVACGLYNDSPTQYAKAIKRLGSIDWRSTGELWTKNLAALRDQDTNKILRIQTGNKFVKSAALAVLAEIRPDAAAA